MKKHQGRKSRVFKGLLVSVGASMAATGSLSLAQDSDAQVAAEMAEDQEEAPYTLSTDLSTFYETTFNDRGSIFDNRERLYLEAYLNASFLDGRVSTYATIRGKQDNAASSFKGWYHTVGISTELLKDNENISIEPYVSMDIVANGNDAWSVGSAITGSYSVPTAAGKLTLKAYADGFTYQSFREETFSKKDPRDCTPAAGAGEQENAFEACDSFGDLSLTKIDKDNREAFVSGTIEGPAIWLDTYLQAGFSDLAGVKGLSVFGRARSVVDLNPDYDVEVSADESALSQDFAGYSRRQRVRVRLGSSYRVTDSFSLSASVMQNWSGLFERTFETGTSTSTFFNSPYQARVGMDYTIL